VVLCRAVAGAAAKWFRRPACGRLGPGECGAKGCCARRGNWFGWPGWMRARCGACRVGTSTVGRLLAFRHAGCVLSLTSTVGLFGQGGFKGMQRSCRARSHRPGKSGFAEPAVVPPGAGGRGTRCGSAGPGVHGALRTVAAPAASMRGSAEPPRGNVQPEPRHKAARPDRSQLRAVLRGAAARRGKDCLAVPRPGLG
jgi:hypothetical protein